MEQSPQIYLPRSLSQDQAQCNGAPDLKLLKSRLIKLIGCGIMVLIVLYLVGIVVLLAKSWESGNLRVNTKQKIDPINSREDQNTTKYFLSDIGRINIRSTKIKMSELTLNQTTAFHQNRFEKEVVLKLVVANLIAKRLDITDYPNLRQLIIEQSVKIDFLVINNTNLQSFQLNSSTIQKLWILNNRLMTSFKNSALSNLKTLIIQTTNIQIFSKLTFGNLKTLEFRNFSISEVPVLDSGLQELNLSSNNITILDVSVYRELRLLCIKDNPLVVLNIGGDSELGSLFLENLPALWIENWTLPYAENISIKSCGDLTIAALSITAPLLKTLTLQDIKVKSLNLTKFSRVEFSLNLPLLEELIANNNPTINNLFVESLNNSINLRRLSLINTRISTFVNIYLPSLEYLCVGEGVISKFQIVNSPKLRELVIEDNPTQQIRVMNVLNLSSLKISIIYSFFSYLTFENSNINSFENITAPQLSSFLLTNVNFSSVEPFSRSLPSLFVVKIKNSDIRRFNQTKFPNLVDLNYQNCPNLKVITSSKYEAIRKNRQIFRQQHQRWTYMFYGLFKALELVQ